ncbi:hypothetical protein DL96DRAFT_1685458 [Flagelloscypha sp. PMI_526]|nr:hypothetical protein DL96DRAFT_1685458 [Flagelloscypha sp. PMI_526]
MASSAYLPSSPGESSSQKSDPGHSYAPEVTGAQYASTSTVSRLKPALDWLKFFTLPAIAIGYLALCYVAYKDIVPIAGHGLFDDSPKNIAKIKAGITTISILVIAITSEEFFRTLSTHKFGVPLATVNDISTPSYGIFSALSYFATATLGGFFVIAATSLAPVSAKVVLFDGDLVAFSVGSLPSNALLNTTDDDSLLAFLFGTTLGNEFAEEGASMAWAQSSLGVSSAFKASVPDPYTNKRYIIPVPKELNSSMSARWLTDVLSISPSCTFPRTNITQNISQPNLNLSLVLDLIPGVLFPDIDLAIQSPLHTGIASSSQLQISQHAINDIINGTSGDMDISGASVWTLSQCVEGCSSTETASMTFNLSGLPTFRIQYMDDITNTSTSVEITYLACLPHVERETREIRVDSSGNVFVEPLPTKYRLTKQRNIDLIQGRFLMNIALSKLASDGGPSHNDALGIGSVTQVNMIFPKDVISQGSWYERSSLITGAVRPLPEKEITENYGRILQAAASTFLVAGNGGRANVPGRVYYPSLVFTASLPHIIASTCIFGILSLLMLIAQFRHGKGESFTLYRLNRSLYQSNLPEQLSSAEPGKSVNDTQLRSALQVEVEKEAIKALGNRKVLLGKGSDGWTPVLSLAN